MAKFYSGIDTSVGLGAETLDGMLANGSTYGISPSQDIDCANINASGIHTVGGFFYPNGGIKDSSNSTGTSGKVLSSTGSGLAWIDPSEGSTTNAINVGTNLDSTNADQFVAFMGTSSGNNPVRVDAGLKYNPSTNLLKAGNVELPNLGEFTLGGNQELKMFHKDDTDDVRVEVDSNTNYILLTKTFDLKNAAGSKAAITANESGGVPEVRLHHDGNERLKTTNDGVTISGSIIANGGGVSAVGVGTFSGLDISGSIIANGGGNLLKLNGQDSTAPSVNLEIHTHDTAGATAEISLNARDTSNVNRISKIVADADGDNNVNLIFHTDNTERLRISGTGNIIQSGTSNYIRINGGLQDKDGQDGDSGQVLSSTGSQVNWVNVGDLSAGSASQIAVSDESSDTTCFPLFVTGATGNQSPKSGSNLTFNSSTGALSATSFSGSIAASNINSGTLGTDRIPNLAASKITSGTLGTARIPNLAASKITSGTLGTARIPNLAASKITSGTLGTDRIPSLAASKITSGQFDTARIPTLNQNTTGTSGGLSGSPSITVTNITIDGQLRDGDNAFGSSGQVLSSDGTDTKWINAGSLSAGAAAQVAVNATNTTNSSHFIAFTETSSGNEEIRVDNSLTYNPSTNVLTAGTFSGSVAASNVDSGTLGVDRIPSLPASKITSGQLDAARIPTLNQNTTGNAATATSATTAATVTTAAQTNITSLGTLTGLNVNGTLTVQNGNSLDFGTATNNNIRGQIGATETNDRHLIIATSTGEDIAFRDGGLSGTTNMIIRGDGNVLISNGNLLCSGTASVANTLTVTGSEGTDSIIELLADDGDDNEDKWRIRSDATGNDLKFESYYSGSWSDGSPLKLAGNGIVTMPGQAIIDEVNINGNVVQTNTSNELVVRGKGTGGSHHLKLDDDVTIVGDLTVQGVGGFVTGMILLWSGAQNAIPSGWYLCDGNNGTPDLRDRFVVGAGSGGSYSVGDTGGSKDATLVSHSHTINNHTHSFSGSSSHSHTVNNHTHSFSGSGSNTHNHNIFSTDIDDHNDSARRIENSRNDWTGYYPSNRDISTDNATISISISGTTGGSSPGTNSQTVSISGNTGNPSNTGTNSQGSSATNANLPPYYALCYIMKS